MFRSKWIKRFAAVSAFAMACAVESAVAQSPVGGPVSGGQPPAAASPVADVVLSPGGVFRGQAVDPRGTALASAPVVLLQNGRPICETAANSQGYFQINGVRGGMYDVSTVGGTTTVRLWTEGTAPPTAQPGLLLVNRGDVISGQAGGGGGVLGALKNPWVGAGLISAAIAVPIALNNNSPGS